MKMNKILLAVFLAVFMLLLSFQSNALAVEPPALQKVSLQLNWKHQFEFAGFYAAIEKGFYARRGLDVELVEYDNNMDVINEVVSGHADYGSYNIQVISKRLKGAPITLLGNYFKRYPLVILTQNGISTFEELKGKRLMIADKDLHSPLIRYILKNAGLIPEKNITIIPHSFTVEPFVKDKIDAMMAYLSNEPFQLNEQEKDYQQLDFSAFVPTIGENFLFTSENKSQTNPQQARDFLEASNEGWKYALAHQDEIIELILKKYSNKKSPAALKFEAERVAALIMPHAFPIGSISVDRLRPMAEILLEMGEVKSLDRLEGFLLSSPKKAKISLSKAEQQTPEKTNTLWNLLIAFVCIFIVLLVSLYFILPRFSSEERLAKSFSSGKFRLFVLLILSLIVSLSALLIWHTLKENYSKTLRTAKRDLESSLEMSQQHLNLFISERKSYLSQLGKDSELVRITEQLLQLSNKGKSLKNSKALKQARDFFEKRKDEFNHHGFFIISPDNISLASQRDTNTGTQNFINFHEPQRIKHAFAGNTVFIPPIISDVPFNGQNTAKTLFFAAPIKNAEGQVIAILTQRLIPEKLLMPHQHTHNTNEIYLVDKEGDLLTHSFRQFLTKTPVLKNNLQQKPFLFNAQKDNLLEDYQPSSPSKTNAVTPMTQGITQLSQQERQAKTIVDVKGYHNNQGIFVYGAWLWNKPLGIGLVTEIKVDEVLVDYEASKQTLLLITGMTLLLSLVTTLITLLFGQKAARTLNNSRDELENQVKIRTERLVSIINNADDGIIVLNSGGFIEDFSPAAEKIFIYSCDRLLGKPFTHLLDKSFKKKFASYFDLHQKLGLTKSSPLSSEAIGKRSDNSLFEMEFSLSVIAVKNERLFTVIMRDISDRKAAQEQLIHSRDEQTLLKKLITLSTKNKPLPELLEQAIEIILSVSWLSLQSRGAIFLHDAEKNELKLVANKRLAKPLLTLCNKVAMGQCLCGRAAKSREIVFANCVDDRHETHFEGMTEHGHYCLPILYNDTLLGVITLYLPAHHQPLPNEDKLLKIVASTLASVINQKQMENAMQAARQDADIANKAKSQFVANMSHELRTPLNAILGFSQIMTKGENLTEKQQKNLQIINNSGEHLLNLINDILDISKIEAGKIELHKTDFNLYPLVESVTDIFKNELNKKGLTIIREFNEKIPPIIHSDKTKLRQILVNLMGNALKFTSQGNITLRLNFQQSLSNNLMLYFEVEDTGCGIAQEDLTRVFHNFVQTSSGLTSEQGSGLGLTISYQFAQLMGGDMSVESEINKGSVFKFHILVDTAQSTDSETAKNTFDMSDLSNKSPSYRILIADDDEINRLVLTTFLSPLGYELKEAENGQQAVDLCHTWHPHCVLMDIQMPIVDGYEATRQIKALSKQTVIIAITANTFDHNQEKSFQAGCNDYIAKPFELPEVLSKIQEHLESQYLYETNIETIEKIPTPLSLNTEAINSLDVGLKAQLKHAILIVDIDEIEDLLEHVYQQNPQLSDAIKQHIDNFEYDLLLTLFG